MASTFFDITKLRILQESEVDYDSPGSEELFTQIRENSEALLHLHGFSGSSGTATQAPTSEEFWDSNAAWGNDDHNGKSLVILSGDASGKYYTIDDTIASGGKLVMTGDDLSADGVASGAKYKIFYDLQSTMGHNHDGTNSREVELAKGRASVWSYIHHDATSTGAWSTTSANFTTTLNNGPPPIIGIIIPPEANYLYPAIKVQNPTNNARVWARIIIGTKASSEVTSTNNTAGWKAPTVGLDCSTMASGVTTLRLQAKAASGATYASVKGVNVFWGP